MLPFSSIFPVYLTFILFILLLRCDNCISFFKSDVVLPIFQCCRQNDHATIDSIGKSQFSYGVSLNPPTELKVINNLFKLKSPAKIYACDVKTVGEVVKLKEMGCSAIFVSVTRREVIREAKLMDMIVICDGNLLTDYDEALVVDANAFRFRTQQLASFQDVEKLISRIKTVHKYVDLPIFVTPGQSTSNLEKIMKLDDKIQMITELDLSEQDESNMMEEIRDLNADIQKIKLEMKIKSDLKNSCL